MGGVFAPQGFDFKSVALNHCALCHLDISEGQLTQHFEIPALNTVPGFVHRLGRGPHPLTNGLQIVKGLITSRLNPLLCRGHAQPIDRGK